MNENCQIRHADSCDATFLAKVLVLSARSHLEHRPGFWDIVLGGTGAERDTYLERLVLVEERCPAHWRHFLIAEIDGKAAAALAGYDSATDGGRFGLGAIAQADQELERGNTAASIAFQHAAQVFQRCAWTDNVEPGAWIIEYVATLPEFRRRGLMRRLLERTLADGRARGCPVARVQVFIDNTSAENVYLNAGFTVACVRRDQSFEDFFGAPGMKLFRRAL